MYGYFIQALVYLCAAVVMVPIAKRLGLGSVLGYLVAGVLIGPVLGVVGQETETIQHFAEFGVVMMLFLVGLELEPRVLWDMRTRLLGLGGLQVLVTLIAVMGIAMVYTNDWRTALAIGMIFSLSSTAIVLQTFNEKGMMKTVGAKNAFSVLLFQDIAVLPMLALIPLLAVPELAAQTQSSSVVHQELSLVAELPVWAHGLAVVFALVVVTLAIHYLSRPLFRYVAQSGLQEIFTTTALLLVLGTAILMHLLGLSPALGTFLAGVVLASSEFRHELESNIEPFKGLLMGLFFITVGAGINFDVVVHNANMLCALVIGVMAIKAAILYVAARLFKIESADRWLFTLSLCQAGEFGFVLLNYAGQNHVLNTEMTQILSLVVALSMFLTPGLFILFDKLILPSFTTDKKHAKADDIDEQGIAIIAGIGRFGQVVNRMLVANGVKTVALDHEAAQVELMRKLNIKSFYGDATRPELLATAGIEHARLLVVAINDPERIVQLVRYMKKHYPKVKIIARATNRSEVYRLKYVGADVIIPEVFHSALEAGKTALTLLGEHPFRAEQLKNTFMETELAHKKQLYETWRKAADENTKMARYRELFVQLEEVLGEEMKRDRSDGHTRSERGWTPPPKGYVDEIADQSD